MSRSDAQSTRIGCPTQGCSGRLQLRTDRTPTAVRCPRCRWEIAVDALTAALLRGAA